MVQFMLQCSTVQHRIAATATGWEMSKARLRPVGRAAVGSGASTEDLRHDGNDDENGDREDEHDQRPGCGMPHRDTPSR